MNESNPFLRQFIGSRLRAARAELHLSQQEAAAASGVTQSYLSMIESGKRSLQAEDLFRMASIYQKPITYFFPNRDAPAATPNQVKVERSILFWADDPEHYGDRNQYWSPDNVPPDEALLAGFSIALNARIVEVIPRTLLKTQPMLSLPSLTQECMRQQSQNKLGFMLNILDLIWDQKRQKSDQEHAHWLARHMNMTTLWQNMLPKDSAFCGIPPAGEQRERLVNRLPSYCKDWRIIENWPKEVFERHLQKL